MGVMKDLYITIHNGGDEAVAAVQRMGDDWRAQLEQAAAEIEALRLTDAEREAVLYFSGHYAGFHANAMHGLALRLGLYDLPRNTPDKHATPSECSEHGDPAGHQ